MVLAIDLGATNIKAALVEDYKIVSEIKSFPTNASLGREQILIALKKTINSLINNKVNHIAVSSAGDIDQLTSTITYATLNLPGMIGFNFDKFCYDEFKIHATAINDGLAALLGEVRLGAAKNYQNKSVLMLTLGTGIGSAVYKNSILTSKKYGHIRLIDNGALCTCGKRGCAECYLSCKAIESKLKELHIDKNDVFKENFHDENEFLTDYLNKFSTFLKLIKNDFKYDYVIIGGGITNWMGKDFERIFSFLKEPIIKASLLNTAGFLGAYCDYMEKCNDNKTI